MTEFIERMSGAPIPVPGRHVDGPGCTPAVVSELAPPAVVHMATCTPNSAPYWHDGLTRCEHGWQLNVLDADLHIVVTVDLPDWDEFRPASAGHRLIEQGWMIRPDARGPETVNGWREIGSGYVTQVISTAGI